VSIGNLVNLTSLDVNNNQLAQLPSSIGNLVNLSSLNVGSSQLTSLPVEVGNLVNLTSFNTSGNQLASLPSSIGNLVNLNYFVLNSNQLTSLPALPSSIITLYAGVNQLKAFTQTLPNCLTLDLGYNQMTLQDYEDSIPFFNLLPNGGTCYFGGNIDSIAGTAAETILYNKGWSVNI
jgi:Leucine-rich repeat (LRR) protein